MQSTNSPAAFARRMYEAGRTRLALEPTNSEAAWRFGMACFEWADHATNDLQKASIANEGILACRQLIIRDPTLAQGHYYLALNLGRLADTKRNLAALKMVGEMESEFKLAAGMKPDLDYSGPDRGLGNLYKEAPGWPVSVGSKSKARLNLKKAVSQSPEFPENQLCLIEAYSEWGEKKTLQPLLPSVELVLVKAHEKFTGEEWAGAWIDWNQRWKTIKAKYPDTTKPR